MVAGLARAGQAAARALIHLDGAVPVRGWDRADNAPTRETRDELAALGVEVELGGDGTGLLDAEPAPRALVKSPGVAFDVPLVAEAARRRLTVIDELELGWRLDDRPIVGITGTNGKSTVSELIRALLDAAGRRPALAGNTIFGPPLSGLAEPEAGVVVAEVSSYQLEGCPAFVPDAAVVTNLTMDHFERHATMRDYAAAKRRIALRDGAPVAVAVVGVDEPFGVGLARELERAGSRVTRVGRGDEAAYRLESTVREGESTVVSARANGEALTLDTTLAGDHNALNTLMALALADALEIPRATSLPVLAEAVAPPGRLQRVEEGQPFDAIVDYAHNPTGIEAMLRTARELAADRDGAALRVVIGALRVLTDEQRQAMGAAAARDSDDLVLTTDRVSRREPADECRPASPKARARSRRSAAR